MIKKCYEVINPENQSGFSIRELEALSILSTSFSYKTGIGINKSENKWGNKQNGPHFCFLHFFEPDNQDIMLDGQRIVVSSKTQRPFTSSPVQITEKLRKAAFHPVFCSVLSPHDATGRNPRCRGINVFRNPFPVFLRHRCEKRLF